MKSRTNYLLTFQNMIAHFPPPKSEAQKIADSLHEARRFDELPESLQIARVNGQIMKWQLSQADGQRKIFQILARFDGLISDI